MQDTSQLYEARGRGAQHRESSQCYSSKRAWCQLAPEFSGEPFVRYVNIESPCRALETNITRYVSCARNIEESTNITPCSHARAGGAGVVELSRLKSCRLPLRRGKMGGEKGKASSPHRRGDV